MTLYLFLYCDDKCAESAKNEIVELSSIPAVVICVYFALMTFGKGMNPLLLTDQIMDHHLLFIVPLYLSISYTECDTKSIFKWSMSYWLNE